ncbi:OLC1v1016211C1 [Oldenlandia corymbosa var. corymbosa]|uniref:OLC1v1016211C1 n=1 Tax=Oldenlandia corymbosa var. corymbosa TaxID=529605 RepID=A0AAV1E7A8_OLDCO|nr:OLC1v1016211C1 [Oldenlandia corymbosa var. corymbosa]
MTMTSTALLPKLNHHSHHSFLMSSPPTATTPPSPGIISRFFPQGDCHQEPQMLDLGMEMMTPPPQRKSTGELMKEIATLEVQILHLESYLLSLYRTAFQHQIVPLPKDNRDDGTIPQFVEHENESSQLQKHITDSCSPDCETRNSTTSPGRCSLGNNGVSRSPCSDASICSYDDEAKAPAQNLSSAGTIADDEAQADDVGGRGARTLADHFGSSKRMEYSLDHHNPGKLSEEMVRCMCCIYCKFANTTITPAAQTVPKKGFSISSASSSASSSSPSSTTTFSPRNNASNGGSWSSPQSSSEDIKEGYFEDTTSYGATIEVLKICLDDDSFKYAATMLQRFRLLVEILESVDPRKMKREEKLAFWLNIHNALVMHGYLAYGTNLARSSSILKAAYKVGGHSINAHVIQSSILGIRSHFSEPWLQTLMSPKKKKTAKHIYALEYPEPLVHFALCSGSCSDPLVRIYSASNVFQDLKVARDEFIRATVSVHKETKLYLPKVLSHFAKEMLMSMAELMETVYACLPEETQEKKKAMKGGGREEKLYVSWIPQSSTFRFLIHKELVARNESKNSTHRRFHPAKEDGDEARRSELEESLNSNPDDPSLHFQLGLLLWEKGVEESKSKAAEHFVISAKLNPQNGNAFRYLGDYYAQISRDSQRALKCYQRAVILDPDDSLAGDYFCDLLDQEGKITLQFSVCSEAAEKSPRAFWASRRLGYLLVHQKKWSEAVPRLQHAIRGNPTCTDLWEVLGLSYQRLGMFTAALKSYGRAIELEESRIFALIESGNVSLMLGWFRKAVEHFKQALGISPQNVAANYGLSSAIYGLAKECIDSGAYKWGASLLEEASEVVARIMSLAGNVSAIWKLHGDIQLLHAKCFSWEEDSLSLDSENKDFDNSLAAWKRTCYVSAVSASRSYQRALHLVPWQAKQYADVAVASNLVLHSKNNSGKDFNSWSISEKMCLGALLLEGDNYDFWVTLGCLSHHTALRQHALIRGLQLDVSLAVAWAYLGKLYRKEGRRQLAQQAFDRARSIDPSLALPWAGMAADADVRNLKPDEAYECCLRAVQIMPIAEFQIGLANLALYSGHLPSSEILGAMQLALLRGPHYPESHNLHGLVCEARSDFKGAVNSFRLAQHAVNSVCGEVPKVYLKHISINLARTLCKAGNLDEAVQECERLKTEGLLDLKGQQIYALSLWKLGKNDLALSAIRTLAGSILSVEPKEAAAASIVFITRLTYHISGQQSAIMNILKMPKDLFQSSKVCFVISAIHVLDQSNQLESLVSHSRRSLVSNEEITSMHSLIALGKIVKPAFKASPGIENGIHHLRKALHMYPNSSLLRNFLGYLLLSCKEWNDVHLASRCCVIDHPCDHPKLNILEKSAIEILGAGTVACYTIRETNDKLLFSNCGGDYLSGTWTIRHLQKCLHQQPWNYQARYLLILNYLQRARIERFPRQLCSILARLIAPILSENLSIREEYYDEYQRFQLLLCSAEVCLQLGDNLGCVKHAACASKFSLSDNHLAHAHLLLCRAYAAEDDYANLSKEYRRCLDLKFDCHVGWLSLKIIDSLYKIQTDDTILAVGFEECSRDVKNTWRMWLAVFHLVQGLVAIKRNDFLSAEEFLAQACSFVDNESCLFLCHGVVCMELARQLSDAKFLSSAVKSLKKAKESSSPLPMVSLLLAQAEGSLGSKVKWEKNLSDEWFSWPQEMMKPAELYFQMYLVSSSNSSYALPSSSQSYLKWILQAIHLNPSALRYWKVLQNVTR